LSFDWWGRRRADKGARAIHNAQKASDRKRTKKPTPQSATPVQSSPQTHRPARAGTRPGRPASRRSGGCTRAARRCAGRRASPARGWGCCVAGLRGGRERRGGAPRRRERAVRCCAKRGLPKQSYRNTQNARQTHTQQRTWPRTTRRGRAGTRSSARRSRRCQSTRRRGRPRRAS
jgi:hypothetical protein